MNADFTLIYADFFSLHIFFKTLMNADVALITLIFLSTYFFKTLILS